jgi:uncharacterized protein
VRLVLFLLPLALTLLSACGQPPISASVSVAEIERWRLQARGEGYAVAENSLYHWASSGNATAQRALGEVLLRRSAAAQHTEGLNWLTLAALQGDSLAQRGVGKLYLAGNSPVARDYFAARRWFNAAARAGDGGAAYYLGVMDRNGYGAPQDFARALVWLKIAAQQNVVDAMFLLGNAYAAGEGAPQDRETAMKWYQQAADQEHPEALQQLAMAYRDGSNGMQRDNAAFEAHVMEVSHSLKHPQAKP